MKHALYIIIIPVFALLLPACSNDFLHQGQNLVELSDTLYMSDSETVKQFSVQVPGGTNAAWQIFRYNKWLSPDKKSGVLQDGKITLTLTFSKVNLTLPPGIYNDPLIFYVEHTGYVTVPFVFYLLGTPSASVYPSLLNLYTSETGSFSLSNQGEGILAWSVTHKPDWLGMSLSHGMIYQNSISQVNVTVDKSQLTPGDYTDTIRIRTNAPTGDIVIPVYIKVTEIYKSGIVTQISGEVVAAGYNKATDMMLIATRNPNRLLLTHTTDNVQKTISLDKEPSTAIFSDDGQTVAVGFTTNELGLMNVAQQVFTKTISLDCTPYCIALGNNGWAYVVPLADQWSNIRNVSLSTGQYIQTVAYSTWGKSILKKVPGRNLLIGNIPGLSPDGLDIYDISSGAINPKYNHYHISPARFWFSDSGELLFCGNRKVYATPAYQPDQYIMIDQPPVKGELVDLTGIVSSMEHNAAINRLYVAATREYDSSLSDIIYVYDASVYAKKYGIAIGKMSVPNDTSGNLYPSRIAWLFTNQQGKILYLLEYGYSYFTYQNIPGSWRIEKITL